MKRSLSLLSMFLIVVGHVFAQGPTGTPPPVVVSQVTVSNDTKRLVFPTPSEFAQSNDILMTNGSAFNLTNFPSYLLTNTLINGRLGNVSNRIAVTTLSLQDITSADGTNVINGALAVYGDIYGSASNLTNFPAILLTNEVDTLATVLARGNDAAGQSATNFGGLSSTGVVDLASKSGLTNSPSRLTLADQLFENLDGGTFIGRDNVTRKRELMNVGETWAAKDSIRDWNDVSISSDGKYQTAVVWSGQIYVSADYGQTWTAKDSSRLWSSVSLSSDGKYQTAVEYYGQIYVSSDYGQNWTAKDSIRYWNDVSISSDGKYQTVVEDGIRFCASSDYGQNWTAKDSIVTNEFYFWLTVSISSDGKYQTAAWSRGEGQGQILISSDYGQNWAAKGSIQDWADISLSSDGKYQTAVVDGGQIYVSVDYGQTWTAKDESRLWSSVSLSSDGKYQTAVAYNDQQIYVSVDYGQTWTAKDSSRDWKSVSISSDGKYQTAVEYGGLIYVSVADEVIRGNLYYASNPSNRIPTDLASVLTNGNDAAGQSATNFNYLHQTNQAVLFELKDNENIGLESTGYPVTEQYYGTWAGVGALCNNNDDGPSEYNNAFGYQSLYNSTGSYNIAFGSWALMGLNGDDNIGIGNEAFTGGSGTLNTIVGSWAAYHLSGDNNIGVGFGPLNDSLTDLSIAVGYNALELSSGDMNIGIGYDAFSGDNQFCEGDFNVCVGNWAGVEGNGDANTFIGDYSGDTFVGMYNTALGGFALSGGGGDYNVAIGGNSMYSWSSVITGNTAVGTYAMGSLYGSYNTSLGYESLSSSRGNRNVAIGSYAGANNCGSDSIFIGAGSGNSRPYDDVSNSISIGADAPSLGDNTMVLGNEQITNTFIYGNIAVTGSIIPVVSNEYDIGSSDMPFRHGYFGTNSLYLGDYKVSKDKAQTWDAGGTNGNNAFNLTNFPANVASTNYVAGIIAGSGKLWMTDNGATSILYHVTSGGRTNKIGEYFSTP